MRLAEWDQILRTAQGVGRADPTSLTLDLLPAPGRAATVRDLAGRETECCSFFTFSLEETDGLRLHVAVPPAYAAVLDSFAARAARLAGLRQ